MNLTDVKNMYNEWAAKHPWGAGLVITAEAAVIGGFADLFMNGVDFSKNGVRHALTIIAATSIAAIRNYVRQSPKQIAANGAANGTPPAEK